MNSEPQEHRISPDSTKDGVELCYFEWGTKREGQPTWFFCHATGFHARCWDKVIAGLPADAHAIAVDMRGHGRSAKVLPLNWQNFGDDTVGLIEALDLKQIIGIGHSMGGHAITQASARLTTRFERVILVDPVIFDPEIVGRPSRHDFGDVSNHPVARRKGSFASWEAMYERFADRAPYSYWQPEILEDYCRYGVLPAESDEGDAVTLACPPVMEASVYMGSTDFDLRPLLPAITVPVVVLRARAADPSVEGMDFSSSPTWAGLADALPNAVDIHLPELTHFIAMQAPEIVLRCALEPIGARAQLEDLLAAHS